MTLKRKLGMIYMVKQLKRSKIKTYLVLLPLLTSLGACSHTVVHPIAGTEIYWKGADLCLTPAAFEKLFGMRVPR